ncbi:hypothetical protein SAMN04515671_1084 [Nakamurella panacisegetis]|uniref:Uncharacterized protein n=1 Tax=Nakamurella panacisegetis TaxID=1090615 RepID=A0A1H0JXG3_9ACTN|nr:hypothetical protein SAMN04515671_1084 [Nakamurella panacisegetis]
MFIEDGVGALEASFVPVESGPGDRHSPSAKGILAVTPHTALTHVGGLLTEIPARVLRPGHECGDAAIQVVALYAASAPMRSATSAEYSKAGSMVVARR